MNEHNWHMPGRVDGEAIVWSTHGDPYSWTPEGWRVEEDDGRFEVYYHTNEAMRLGADGSLSIGQPEGYWFTTREWAELCAERLNSLDRAFGRGPSTMSFTTTGNFGIGIGTQSPMQPLMFEIKANASHVLMQIEQNGQVTKFDLPAFAMAWWRGTKAYRAWRVLMWGEKA